MPWHELLLLSSLVLAKAFGCFGAWLLVSAAVQKMFDFPRFSATLAAYRIAPQRLTGVAAFLVVALEVLAAVVLLVVFFVPLVQLSIGSEAHVDGSLGASHDVEAWSLPALALLAPVLILGYACAMAVNLRRGRRSIDCGCGGVPMPLSKSLVVRNLVLGFGLIWALLILSSSHLWPSASILVGGSALLLVLSSSLVLCFVYLVVNQLLANRALHAQLWVQH